MIQHRLSFELPKPWNGERFEGERFGTVNFLVGPNGSGKSRFADALKSQLSKVRMLGTDRLRGLESVAGLQMYGDPFGSGFGKKQFSQLKNAANHGYGLDALVVLEERPDIRIKVEATLTNLFDKRIELEWDSGFLIPRAIIGKSGGSYRIDKEECHGIKELLVLLTHLYSDQQDFLIIDEPELNLHPQFQSFLMQEVRRLAGDPAGGSGKKCFFLITHSPFIVDLRTIDDVRSIISFKLDHSVPTSLANLDEAAANRLISLVPRLNVYHKQLFFSDNPIFVEGRFDAQIIEGIQERRELSIIAAGSCLIEVGGAEEVNKYLELCGSLHKAAFFFYDLDSLFLGTLRQSIRADGSISEFLAGLGVDPDFGRYCGELDKRLTEAVKRVRSAENPPPELETLRAYLDELTGEEEEPKDKNLARARVALLVANAQFPDAVSLTISKSLAAEIQGRVAQIANILKQKNVLLLTRGALENYLGSYKGNPYKIPDDAKRETVSKEAMLLASGSLDGRLRQLYFDLYTNIEKQPAKPPVDLDAVLMEYLGDYVHALQGAALGNPAWSRDEIQTHLKGSPNRFAKLFHVEEFARDKERFQAIVTVVGDTASRFVRVSDETNAGMRRFQLEIPAKTDAHGTQV